MFKKMSVMLLMLGIMPFMAFAEEVTPPMINSSASYSEEFAPDTARIKFFVTNTGLNVNDIKEKNDKIVNDTTTKIKAKLKL